MSGHDACHQLAADGVRADPAPYRGFCHGQDRQEPEAEVASASEPVGRHTEQYRGNDRWPPYSEGFQCGEKGESALPDGDTAVLFAVEYGGPPSVAGPSHERVSRNGHNRDRPVVWRHTDIERQRRHRRSDVHLLSRDFLQHNQSGQGAFEGGLQHTEGHGFNGARGQDTEGGESDRRSGRPGAADSADGGSCEI